MCVFFHHIVVDIFITDKCFMCVFSHVCACCRCFALIDSSTLEQTRDETETDTQTHLESLVELGLSSTVSTILTQCSTEIYKVVQKHTPSHISKITTLHCAVTFKMVFFRCRFLKVALLLQVMKSFMNIGFLFLLFCQLCLSGLPSAQCSDLKVEILSYSL